VVNKRLIGGYTTTKIKGSYWTKSGPWEMDILSIHDQKITFNPLILKALYKLVLMFPE
jgi:hypothetical protein